MRIYQTEPALFCEFYQRQEGLLKQVVIIKSSLIKEVCDAVHSPHNDETVIRDSALSLFVLHYEKNPNWRERANVLANEIRTPTIKQFQKVSEFLGKAEPEWEVPIFVVTWLKRKSDINQVLGNPVCSKCKKELKNIGNYFDDVKAGGGRIAFTAYTDGTGSNGIYPDVASGWDQWLGTVCPNCDFIFCSDCLDSTGKGHCPECNIRVIPALAKDLPIKQKFIGDTSSIKTHSQNLGNDDKVVFVREIKKQIEFAPAGKTNTYMVYRADSSQIAQDFLSKRPVNEDNIIVETPQGNFVKNKDGIYKES